MQKESRAGDRARGVTLGRGSGDSDEVTLESLEEVRG